MTATRQGADAARRAARGFERVTTKRLLRTPDHVWQARRIVATTLGRGHPCLDDVLPLTSEVARSALRAAESVATEGELTLIVEATTTWARVEVREGGSQEMPRLMRAQTDSAGGRETMLLDSLADRWGASQDERGAAVWFEARA